MALYPLIQPCKHYITSVQVLGMGSIILQLINMLYIYIYLEVKLLFSTEMRSWS